MHTSPVFEMHHSFPSQWVDARHIEVMLPPGYNPSQRYDVLYMHDGQNIFNADTSFAGVHWNIQSPIDFLFRKGLIRPAIVVAIWNTPKRLREYMPDLADKRLYLQPLTEEWKGPILSEEYLKFLVYELKPYIDIKYATSTLPEHTHIMGSSMGGLISLYAVNKYPDVFGNAACLSTHWPAYQGAYVEVLPGQIPYAGRNRIYFDYGTETLDSEYEPWQKKVDVIMQSRGYTNGKDWVTLKFSGHDHSESAWAERVDHALKFLLGV